MITEENEEEDSLMSEEVEDIKDDFKALNEDGVWIKDTINDENGMLAKIEEIKLVIPGEESVPWIETLEVCIPKIDLAKKSSDDLEREKQFYDSTLKGVLEAMTNLKKLNIYRDRPEDYFAEMLKTDIHMKKVKGALLKEKRIIEAAQLRTKRRIESKYIKTAQATSQELKSKEKKEELEAIRKWRKLRKKNEVQDEFPTELLDPKSQLRKQLSIYKKKAQKRKRSIQSQIQS